MNNKSEMMIDLVANFVVLHGIKTKGQHHGLALTTEFHRFETLCSDDDDYYENASVAGQVIYTWRQTRKTKGREGDRGKKKQWENSSSEYFNKMNNNDISNNQLFKKWLHQYRDVHWSSKGNTKHISL